MRSPRGHGSAEYVPGVSGWSLSGRAWSHLQGFLRAVLGDFADDITWRRNNRTIVTDDDGTVYVTIASDHGTATTAYHQHDPSPSFPRCIPGRGRGMADDSGVRRGGQRRPAVRLLRDLSEFMAGVRWRAVRTERGGGDPGRAGRDRDEDRGASTRRGQLSGQLVKCEAPYHRLDCVGNCE